MSKMLFKRAAATGAAFVALGFGSVMSVSSAASAAPIHSAAAQTAQVPQAHQSTGLWCGYWPHVWHCPWPPNPRPYPYPFPRYPYPEHHGHPYHGGHYFRH